MPCSASNRGDRLNQTLPRFVEDHEERAKTLPLREALRGNDELPLSLPQFSVHVNHPARIRKNNGY